MSAAENAAPWPGATIHSGRIVVYCCVGFFVFNANHLFGDAVHATGRARVVSSDYWR